MSSETKKLIKIFGVHQFLHWFAIGIIVPVLTLVLMQKGLDLFQVGISTAVYTSALLLLELPTGGLADQIGRVKVYLISVFFSLGAVVLMLLSSNLIIVFIAMGLMGVARSLSTGTIDAWFVEGVQKTSTKDKLQEALAKIEIWTTIGLGCGSLLGGILPMLSKLVAFETYTLNFILIGAVNLGVAFYTMVWIREDRTMGSQGLRHSFSTLPIVLKDAVHFGFAHARIAILITATAFWGFSIVGLENYWQPQVKSLLGSSNQSWIFGILSCGYFFSAAIGSLIITPISRFMKHRYAVILFTIRMMMGICFIILAYRITVLGFGLIYFLLFMQNGMLNSPHQSLFHQNVPDEKRSTLISLESFMMSIGAMVGGLLLGWIAKYYSITHCWTVAGIVFAGSGLCYVLFESKQPNILSTKERT